MLATNGMMTKMWWRFTNGIVHVQGVHVYSSMYLLEGSREIILCDVHVYECSTPRGGCERGMCFLSCGM